MNELLKPFAEIRSDYTDEENLTHIDGYRTGDDNEQGTTLAVVCRDTSKVIYFDNIYRIHDQVQKVIEEVLVDIKQEKDLEV